MNDPKSTPAAPKPEATQILLDTGRRLALEARKHPHPRGYPYLVVRDANGEEALQLLDAESLAEAPTYWDTTVPVHDLGSFCELFNQQARPASRIYASLDPMLFIGVINDHAVDGPDWRDFRIVYAPTFSPEYKAWIGKNGVQFKGNVEWAEWLEDQAPDVVQPSGADMLEIALNFRVDDNVAFSNPTRLQNGRTEFTFNRIVEGHARGAAGKIAIPEQFAIEIPVFAGIGGPRHRFEARFRYRLKDSGLLIWYQLIRPHKVLEAAVAGLISEAADATDRRILLGAPE